MSNWRSIHDASWSFKRDRIFGAGGGTGRYKTAYALNLEGDPFLNGKISADIKIIPGSQIGAGLVCRADDLQTFVAVYIFTAKKADQKYTLLRIAAFKEGAFLPL